MGHITWEGEGEKEGGGGRVESYGIITEYFHRISMAVSVSLFWDFFVMMY